MLQTEDHPIKTIMDLSCLLRRAMEQEMEALSDQLAGEDTEERGLARAVPA